MRAGLRFGSWVCAALALAAQGCIAGANTGGSRSTHANTGSRPAEPPASEERRGPLPEYAAPKGGIVDAAQADVSDVITYRLLTREDFKATEAPPEFAAVAKSVGAATCAYLLTSGNTSLRIQERPGAASDERFEAHIESLEFSTLMNRKCSWWNEQAQFSQAYVLEHEQIHFALYELGARHCNRLVPAAKEQMLRAPSVEAARDLGNREIQKVLQSCLDHTLQENRRFDEDTSMGYAPDRQKAWLGKVTAELAGE